MFFFSNNTRQVGKCGISDQLRQFHSMVYGIFVSENGVDATLLFKYAIELASKSPSNFTINRSLTDGFKALYSACNALSLKIEMCYTHIARPLNCRMTGKRGAKASLPRHLLDQGVDKDMIYEILHLFHGFRYLTTAESWKEARVIFFETYPMFNDDKFKHFQTYYLSEEPKWGNACHKPGEVISTNGAESRWNHEKNVTSELKTSVHGSDDNLLDTLNGISLSQEQISNDLTFSVKPPPLYIHWEVIEKYAQESVIGPDAMCSTYYDLNSGKQLSRFSLFGSKDRDNELLKNGYVVYIPTDSLLKKIVAEVRRIVQTLDGHNMTMNTTLSMQYFNTIESETPIHLLLLEEKKQCMSLLSTYLKNDGSRRKDGENIWDYLSRCAHRDVITSSKLTGSFRKEHDSISKKEKKEKKKALRYRCYARIVIIITYYST